VKISSTIKITVPVVLLLHSLVVNAQVIDKIKSAVPQPIKAVTSPPTFVISPVVPLHPKQADPSLKPVKCPTAAPDLHPYVWDLDRKIKKALFLPKACGGKSPIITFKIHKDGNISNLLLVRSSGIEVADKAWLEAIKKAAPFDPLPEGITTAVTDSVDIQIHPEICTYGDTDK
jgi:TonB family protein